ncbi:Attractin-like protein 1 [Lamellibrachia satsuma]|nr:Attractin-like protein 1 [Lamellibrachia satsuma]
MWCSNERRCVESNSYVVSFLYGQCMEWTTMQSKCPATRCSEMRTCHECKMAPSCGWCNDASDTGLGVCMTGGATGPTRHGSMAVVSSNTCPSERWFFTHCPLCLCNGHSVCRPGTDRCDSCSALVTGPQCQYCKDGYWGTATNGGNCTACDCEDQADTCNRQTGTCDCHTRGVLGKHCDTCDDKYYGNPKDGGTCYYELLTDYQFTFNLSKKEDAHYTHINFMNTPVKSDHDVDFTVNCSGHAYINITVMSSRLPSETYILTEFKCHYLSTKFSHKMYTFGAPPFLLQISFSQFPQIDLIHFFITFFSCFLSLLVLALVFWKLKQKYDSYRREQRRKLMLKQRAKRPAGTCDIDATSPYCSLMATEPPDLLVPRRHRPSKPSPVALEPMMNHKAASLSLLIRLPTGDEDYTPPGVSGLCIGTALVTLGSHRKLSVEHVKPSRAKKPSVTSENCV